MFEIDELFPFKVLSFALTTVLVFWGVKRLSDRKLKVLFTLMMASFFLSTVLFFPEGRINDWNKHIPFYIGQLFFYFFLTGVLAVHAPEAGGGEKKSSAAMQVAAAAPAGFGDWFNFLTDQGLQHIIVLPLWFLIITIVNLQRQYIASAKVKAALNTFIWAGVALVMIHVGEFVVESQDWLPFLESSIEYIEFGWFYLGLALFAVGLRTLAKKESV